MPVAVTIDIPGGNEQFYEQMIVKLFPGGKLPEGWLVHLAGPTESGWRVINVVPSQEHLRFRTLALRQPLGAGTGRQDDGPAR
jgi:hypothetical protein